MSKLVYLTGKARSGKDEVAKIWQKYCPSFTRMAFADEIKYLTSDILKVDYKDLSNPDTKEKYRAFLIYGGQIVRAIDKDYWVKKITSKNQFKNEDVIITDVRFLNEIQELDYRGDYFAKDIISIRIRATDETRKARGANPEFFDDISETELDFLKDSDFNYTIVNDTSLLGLEQRIIEILCKEKLFGTKVYGT